MRKAMIPKPPKGETPKNTIAWQNTLIRTLHDRITSLVETRSKLERELAATESARSLALENVMNLRGQVRQLASDLEASQAKVAKAEAFHEGYRAALADQAVDFRSIIEWPANLT